MNAKVFSILIAILVALILALGGTYYYLFERDTSSTVNQNPTNQIQQQILPQEPQQKEQNFVQETNTSLSPILPTQTQVDFNHTIKQEKSKEEPKLTKQEENKKPNEQPKQVIKEVKDTKKESKQNVKEEKKQEKSQKQIRLSTIKEYQQKGKDSRFEPKLSSETMKVYVMHGKALTQYRIELLEDMLIPVQSKAQDYNLSVFIEMLPKHKMNISIYNKDIIFSHMKKAYKYIDIKQLTPHFNNLNELNSKVKREEIIERIEFKSDEEFKGSDFAKHIKSLKRRLETAQFFFPFTEIIEIKSQK
ncbi:hypothetical protein [Campylobacter vulpis]|uniref:hypothetical protein n=1 Tax=Campylobacter vulpis TaxID=1655500 RepID=UPI001BCD0BAA|nr:hypothetical protein [Campylobacter vulpis]MBS4312958.1 hypothetical protein [Campylobacter vulpis]